MVGTMIMNAASHVLAEAGAVQGQLFPGS